jgi:hypothetical protein
MSVTRRGTNLPLLQSVVRKYSPTTGYVEEFEFAGHDETQFSALAQQKYAAGYEYEWATRYGHQTMRVVDTSGQVAIDSWEVGMNKLSPSTFKNPRNIANVPEADLTIIKKFAQQDADYPSYATALAAITADEHSQALLARVHEGSDSYYASGYVLRHTTNVSNRYQVNVADQNVDLIYGTSELLSECQNSNLWNFPLPGRLAYKVQSLSTAFISRYGTRDRYEWGWLKSGSPESTAANNRVNIVTEFEFFQWSTDEYGQY